MRLSNYFLPVLKEDPIDATIASHRLMVRAGMIRQQSSGLYVWLPLGLRVLKKIENIVRDEMNKAGSNELLMPCIQSAKLWEESLRYDSYGQEMLKIKDRHDNDLLFGPTNEEVITDLFRNNIKSYKELPKNFYHIQWKFRDEIRPRFGLLRCREFYMKDAYSFDLDEESARKSYDNMFLAYLKIFKRMGLSVIPVRADTGAIGGDLSHEFHLLADTGESDIFYDKKLSDEIAKDAPDIEKIKSCYAMADDMHKPEACNVADADLKKHKSIEVGHIFYFGTKYSEPMNAAYMDNNGRRQYVHGGSYGVGVSRLVAAIAEMSHDEKGIIWPKSVAPFDVSIINVHHKDGECIALSDSIYRQLSENGYDVLYDDTAESAGYKFSTQDLIGITYQIIVSSRMIQNKVVEIKDRATGKSCEVAIDAIKEFLEKEYA